MDLDLTFDPYDSTILSDLCPAHNFCTSRNKVNPTQNEDATLDGVSHILKSGHS